MKRFLPPMGTLVAFEAAARHGNFSHAAHELGISQPAVSRAVSTLEEAVGEALFIRAGPRIRLSARGDELRAVMSDSFDAIEKLVVGWRDDRNDRVPVLLSISTSMAAHWLIPRLFEFRLAFPDVDLRFELIAGGVGQGPVKADLGLRRFADRTVPEPDSHYLDEIIQPVATLEYVRRFGTFDMLRPSRAHTLITLSDHWCDWDQFARLSGLKLPPNHKKMYFSDYSVALQSALNGEGVVLSWLSVTSRLLLARSLLAVSDRGLNTGASLNFIVGDGARKRDVLQDVRTWLCAEVAKDVAALRKRQPLHATERTVLTG